MDEAQKVNHVVDMDYLNWLKPAGEVFTDDGGRFVSETSI
jgi:hypothetical protein